MFQDIKKMITIFLGLSLFLSSCCKTIPKSKAYQESYSHLQKRLWTPPCMRETDYFLVILVEARHLDYTNNRSFFRTLTKHPSDGSKNCDVGHAWVYLRGIEDGKPMELEGGHSGELGLTQARYFEGVMSYFDCGYANPNPDQMHHPRYEPNPIKYLWETQHDGFFEEGAGYHRPTFAAKVDITEEQFHAILQFIQEYDYRHYSLTEQQCSTFVTEVARLAGLPIESEVCIQVEPFVRLCGVDVRMWNDPQYAQIMLASPDVVEKSLMQAVEEGRAEYALKWYLRYRPLSLPQHFGRACQCIRQFPVRYSRVRAFTR